jgi:hypothetical protein
MKRRAKSQKRHRRRVIEGYCAHPGLPDLADEPVAHQPIHPTRQIGAELVYDTLPGARLDKSVGKYPNGRKPVLSVPLLAA